jgi:hypothetical protein
MAAFGGYADNFEFPRYGFDVGFLRVYENDAPVDMPDALPWASSPAREGDLVFAAGNPGGTERVQTIEQLALQRDAVLPWVLVHLAELRGTLLQFSAGNPELFRISRARIRTVENGLKALGGRRGWLADPANFERKRSEDAELRGAVRRDPAKEARFGGAWAGIAQAVQAEREIFVRYQLAESRNGIPSDLFEYARLLVRAAEERPKPSPERLRVRRRAPAPAGKPAAPSGADSSVASGCGLSVTPSAPTTHWCRRRSASEARRRSPGRQWPARASTTPGFARRSGRAGPRPLLRRRIR